LSTEVVLSVRDLRTYFYTYRAVVKAVDGISFDVKKGEIMGIVGESGCGKSATALSIARLIEPPGKVVTGELLFNGRDLVKLGDKELSQIRGAEISMIFQDPSTFLNPVLRVSDQIRDVLLKHPKSRWAQGGSADLKSEARKRTVELLTKVGIPDPERIAKEYPHELSGGMKQRVMIAMALACDPSLIIADEPTTNLDTTVQAQILELFRDLIKEYGMSAILVTHDLGVVAETCDRVTVMYAGRVAETATVRDLFRDPKHPYTKGLLAAVPRRAVRVTQLMTIPGTVPNPDAFPPGCRFNPRCSYAFDKCKESDPELYSVGGDHLAACFLYETNRTDTK
jgi:peptide/nickel transport system ATP-binding protein